MSGFYISELCAKGLGKKDAKVSFKRGVNLITGASDTGKSFMFSMISYVLGRSSVPKSIPEGDSYHKYFLEINVFQTDKKFTLFRERDENKVFVEECQIDDFGNEKNTRKEYWAKHNNIEKTISFFLLELCNLAGLKLLKGKEKGETQNLSFKNLINLTFVPEDRIITERSPFYPSGQAISRTPEQSLLGLLLTGKDSSGVKEIVDTEKKELQIKGKLEYIDKQLSSYSKKREFLVKDLKDNDIKSLISYEKLNEYLQDNLKKAKEIISSKNELSSKLINFNERIEYSEKLIVRFEILRKQYESDAKRLEFISETEFLSAQLGDVVCPLCSNPIDENHLDHMVEIESFREAVAVELEKISTKLEDLLDTVEAHKKKLETLSGEKVKIVVELKSLEESLIENINPKITKLKGDIDILLSNAKRENQISFIDEEAEKLKEDREKLQALLNIKPQKKEKITIVDSNSLQQLSKFIEHRLKKWKYENNINVSFDSRFNIFDIDISLKSRKSNGKGKRALSYSASLLGLLDYCLKKKMNFSNLIILDSPLTTFKGKGEVSVSSKDDSINEKVKYLFFEDLAETSLDCQVIIFDNEIPPNSLLDKLNTQIFTDDTNIGRQGFFPISEDKQNLLF